MDRSPVESKVLKSIGYDPVTKTLEVEIISKKPGVPNPVYQYREVPREVAAALMGAESKGSHYLKNFTRGQYPHKRIEETHEEKV